MTATISTESETVSLFIQDDDLFFNRSFPTPTILDYRKKNHLPSLTLVFLKIIAITDRFVKIEEKAIS